MCSTTVSRIFHKAGHPARARSLAFPWGCSTLWSYIILTPLIFLGFLHDSWFSVYLTVLSISSCLLSFRLSLSLSSIFCYLLDLVFIPRQLPHLSSWFSWLTFSSTLAFSFADTTYKEILWTVNQMLQVTLDSIHIVCRPILFFLVNLVQWPAQGMCKKDQPFL